MQVRAIALFATEFDGTRHVDVIVKGAVIGLGMISGENVRFENTGEPLDVHAVRLISRNGDTVLYLDPEAIDGFAVVKDEE